MELPILRTARLTLRPYSLDDIDALHALWIDADVRRYLWDNEAIPRERAEATIRGAVESAERDGIGQWVVCDAATNAVAGFCGFIRRDAGEDPELMYGLAPAFWGRGLATEAARAVLAYGFGELGFSRITAATDPPNLASVAVMERLGMRFTARRTLNGLDTLFYELRREDFGRS